MEERDGKREYLSPPMYLWIMYLTHAESQFPRHKDTSFRGLFGGLNEIMYVRWQRISCHLVVLSTTGFRHYRAAVGYVEFGVRQSWDRILPLSITKPHDLEHMSFLI